MHSYEFMLYLDGENWWLNLGDLGLVVCDSWLLLHSN